MLIKAEEAMQNVKILAITCVNGNTSTDNAIKNTYRILDGLDRTDVKLFINFNYLLINQIIIISKRFFFCFQIPIHKGILEHLFILLCGLL